MMQMRLALFAPVAAVSFAAALLSACASPAGDYPTLAVRDAERVTGAMEVPPPAPPTQPSPETVSNLATLAEQARSANRAFQAAAPMARQRVAAARGASAGSEAWAVAQVALADLESHRSATMVVLADLDRIYVAAASDGAATAAIEAVRDDAAAVVDQQNRLIAELLGSLVQ